MGLAKLVVDPIFVSAIHAEPLGVNLAIVVLVVFNIGRMAIAGAAIRTKVVGVHANLRGALFLDFFPSLFFFVTFNDIFFDYTRL